MAGGNNGIDLSFRRSNTVFGSSLEINGNILNLLNRNGDVISSVEIDLIKRDALPEANAENLGLIYLYTGETGEYTHGNIYECVENSGVYSWENVTDAELAKKLNTDGSNTFTGVLKMKSTISFKGAIAPSWDGIGFFKLNDNDSVTLMASMEDIDGLSPASNNTYNIGTNTRKWKDLYLAGKAYTSTINNGGDIAVPTSAGTMALTSDLTNFADKDLSNLTSTGKNIANWSSNVSNCITEIPQDIKVELNDGTLTLKAGSKIYVPNGKNADESLRFDEYIMPNDRSGGSSVNKLIYCYNPSLNEFGATNPNQCFSGNNAPTSPVNNAYWYDTNSNIIKRWDGTNSVWKQGYCFPICLSSNTSIYQIFNGFGYIGSTVFALPGVKGLIPNGRNEDGSLKNVEFTTSSVFTIGYNTQYDNYKLALNASRIGIYISNPVDRLEYKERENINYNNNTSVVESIAHIGFVSCNGTRITSFTPKTPFHAVDYNDKSTISGWAMPSDRYIDLTLGASPSSYTAPADGWVILRRTSTASGQLLQLTNDTSAKLQYFVQSGANSDVIGASIPVKKGDNFTVAYTLGSSTNQIFRFIYAEGSK